MPVDEEMNDESSREFFGPALPSHLLGKNKNTPDIGQRIYGPVLPQSFRQTEENFKDDLGVCKNSEENVIIGPEIPKHLKLPEQDEEDKEKNNDNFMSSVHDKSDDYIGPSINLMSTDSSHSYKIIRSKTTDEKISDLKKKKRESWMLEPPEKKPVSFDKSKKHYKIRYSTEQEDDRSVWTNTPKEKEQQKDKKKEKDYRKLLKLKKLEERDKEMKLLIEKSKKKQPNSSLLEMHLKKLKEKKREEKKLEKEKGEAKTRRPFDRNIDLQIRRVDKSKSRSILNKASFLNDRFAAGESKFL